MTSLFDLLLETDFPTWKRKIVLLGFTSSDFDAKKAEFLKEGVELEIRRFSTNERKRLKEMQSNGSDSMTILLQFYKGYNLSFEGSQIEEQKENGAAWLFPVVSYKHKTIFAFCYPIEREKS